MDFGSKFVYVRKKKKSAEKKKEEEEEGDAFSSEEEFSENEMEKGLEEVVRRASAGVDTPETPATLLPKKVPPPAPGHRRRTTVRKADTNVLRVALGTLGQKASMATGDCAFCTQCQAVLSGISVLGEADEEGSRVWECEFCEEKNTVDVEDEEKPTEDSVDYVLEAPPTPKKGVKGDRFVVFCVDTSGSMCVSEPVEGKHSFKTKKKDPRLNPGHVDQRLPGEREDVTYVSRLQCMQGAIVEQLEVMARDAPDSKVGLVRFADSVELIGDGVQSPLHVAGDRLKDYDQGMCNHFFSKTFLLVQRIAQPFSIDVTIRDSMEGLRSRVFELEEQGQTALGPALLASVSLAAASGREATEVIVCTDGLANVGIGSLEVEKQSAKLEDVRSQQDEFYEKVATFAKAHGVRVHVISVASKGCRMESLGIVADETNGRVQIVKPTELASNFQSLLSDPVVATKVHLKLMLHRGLYVREDEGVAGAFALPKRAHHSVVRQVGNCTEQSDISFEYGVRDELVDDPKLAAGLPFQLQITYTNLLKQRCIRVITRRQAVTRDRVQAEAEAETDVVGLVALRKAASLAQQGEYGAARLHIASNMRALERHAHLTPGARFGVANFMQQGQVMERALHSEQTEERMRGEVLSDSEEGEDEKPEKKGKGGRKKRVRFRVPRRSEGPVGSPRSVSGKSRTRSATRSDRAAEQIYRAKSLSMQVFSPLHQAMEENDSDKE